MWRQTYRFTEWKEQNRNGRLITIEREKKGK